MAIEEIATDLAEKRLPARERARLGRATLAAVAKDVEYRRNNLTLREDWFQADTDSDRPLAEEVIEAVLRTASEEVQEKKIEFESSLLVSIAYHPEIDRDTAHALIRLATDLTYLQYGVLAVLSTRDRWNLKAHGHASPVEGVIYHAISDLAFRGALIPAGMSDRYGGQSILNFVTMGPMGKLLVDLMELGQIDMETLGKVKASIGELERSEGIEW